MKNAVLLLILLGTVFSWNWENHVLIYMIAREFLLPHDIAKKQLTKEQILDYTKRKEVLRFIDNMVRPNDLIDEVRYFVIKYLPERMRGYMSMDTSRYDKYMKYEGLEPLLVAALTDDIELMGFMTKSTILSKPEFFPSTHFLYQCPDKPLAGTYNIMQAFAHIYNSLLTKVTVEPINPHVEYTQYLMAHLIHLVGDMYQPMHMGAHKRLGEVKGRCEHNEGGLHISVIEKFQNPEKEPDRRGDKTDFRFLWKLHDIWDKGIKTNSLLQELQEGMKWADFFLFEAEKLMKETRPDENTDKLPIHNPEEFVRQMTSLANNDGYNFVNPTTEELKWSDEYKKNARKIAKRLMARAGYTLAQCFKDIYDRHHLIKKP